MLIKQHNKYALLDDNEWAQYLMAVPPIQEAHKYFFNVKCRAFLRYISITLFGNSNTKDILGEFYEFLSKDNWKILRMYSGRNGASLCNYLSHCTINYFMARKKEEEKRRSVPLEQPDIIAELGHFTQEEENEELPVWQAFKRLNERDRKILRLLVIKGKSTLDAADEIWKYVKTENKEWRELPPKRVQDTIAMLKRRALLTLSLELKATSATDRAYQ